MIIRCTEEVELSYVDLQKGVQKYLDVYCGDQFKACNAMCFDAFRLYRESGSCLSNNEALSWALTGKAPDIKERAKQHMNLTVQRTKYMKNLLSYVDDDDVVTCVEESFSQSVRLGNLTFFYPVKIESSKKARVRVLTRMCWFNRYEG